MVKSVNFGIRKRGKRKKINYRFTLYFFVQN